MVMQDGRPVGGSNQCAHGVAREPGQAWVAAEDGQAVGFIILVPQHGYLLLENVAVLPAAPGHGAGARLLALADERARSLHLPEVRLYTNEALTENLAYYPRHGYTETHRAQQAGFRRVFFRKAAGHLGLGLWAVCPEEPGLLPQVHDPAATVSQRCSRRAWFRAACLLRRCPAHDRRG